ncbi:dual specificity protein phosphatase 1 [Morus notabilis]|uniref:dual specificity protein phosphatase 1 n=1 Tax=Morus notabilis TaxID=981085 RepID=UPI000CECFA96|nr:dual specificity protein phosphatase 1 [Morus notabilis]
MDLADETLREQFSALERVMAMSRRFNRDNLPSKIEEGLFLGSLKAARNKEELKKLNITHILTVANYIKPLYPNEFFYKVINVPDSQDADIKQYFDECCNFIDEAKRSGGAVLVHCIVGKSRSVTVVVAYLMKKHGMSLSEALEHVKSKRPIASPNSGFISQLMEFEKYLLGEQSFYSSIQLQSQIILTNMI